jgi:Ca-activated chloride channel family protein
MALVVILAFAGVAAADGMLIPGPPDRPIPDVPNFTVKYHHVTVEIRDQVATTHIDQVFINEANREVEATYLFPLPANSVVRDFQVVADGKPMVSRLMEKDEAVRIYEEIMRQRKDPALFQYVGNNTYQARIYPIPAGGERRIEITYSELLSFDADVIEYVYPLSTEQFSNKPVNETVFNCKIVSKDPIASIYCPSHNVDVDKQDRRHATVSYEESDTRPDRDLELYYTVSTDTVGTRLMTYKEADKDGFFMLLAAPTIEREQTSLPKSVVFVIDRSGSMSGEKIEQAREALTFCVNSLEPEDDFEIVSFSDTIRSFGESLSKAKPARVKAARDWIAGLEASGSTDIDAAMKLAMERRRVGRPNYIVMLTDGLPTSGVTELAKILDNVESRRKKMSEAPTRVFIFGRGLRRGHACPRQDVPQQ